MAQKGFTRIELRVGKTDVALVRKVVDALADPERGSATRAFLRGHLDGPGAVGLKALLAAAPFDDVDLSRAKDAPRAVDL